MRAAGKELLENQGYDIHSKEGKHNYVTDMDLRMQEVLRESLGRLLPQAAFLSEEDMSQTPSPGQQYWMVDPIDGTTNFIHGMGLSCLSVALCRDGKAEAAGVYNPWTSEFFYGQEGGGAFLNQKSIGVSPRLFEDAMVSIGQGYGKRSETILRMRPMWEKCFTGCRSVRGIGSSELCLCYVAAGRLDGYIEQAIMPWDHVAGGLILREAGGLATNWKGEEPSMTGLDSLLGCNPDTHRELVSLAKTLV